MFLVVISSQTILDGNAAFMQCQQNGKNRKTSRYSNLGAFKLYSKLVISIARIVSTAFNNNKKLL